MKKMSKNSIIKRLLPSFVKDAEPDEVAEVLNALTDEEAVKTNDEESSSSDTPSKVTVDSDVLQKVLDSIEAIQKDMELLKTNTNEAVNPLNKVEDELEEVISDEEDNTLAVSDMEEEGLLTDEDINEGETANDAKVVLNLVRQVTYSHRLCLGIEAGASRSIHPTV